MDDLFWMTLLVIFLVPLVGALLSRLHRDPCLRLFEGHHVTMLDAQTTPYWGELDVTSQGLELRFDALHVTSSGLHKGSVLLGEEEVRAGVGFARVPFALTPAEHAEREAQIRKHFRPSRWRRWRRRVRSGVNLVRDALGKSLHTVVGAFGTRATLAAAMSKQKGEMDALSQSLLKIVGNAYEPLLERHIGEPVVVEVQTRSGEPAIDIAGYLVEYTRDFIAVFQAVPQPREPVLLEVAEALTFAGGSCERSGDRTFVRCQGPEPLWLERWQREERAHDLGVVLLPGAVMSLRTGEAPFVLHVARTRQVDWVLGRTRARVRYGGAARPSGRRAARGVAPDLSRELAADDGA